MTEVDNKWGERVRQVRKKHGLSAEKLAERMDISKSQVLRLENGERRLTVGWLDKLALALDVTINDLIADTELSEVVVVNRAVGADVWMSCDVLPQLEQYNLKAPEHEGYNNVKRYGAEVRGSGSENLLSTGEGVFIYVRVEDDTAPFSLNDKFIFCCKRDGKYNHTIRVILADDSGNLWLVCPSSDPNLADPVPYQFKSKAGHIVGKVIGAYLRY